MGSLHFLDLVIGLVFIYFLLSLVCVSLQELKASWNNERSKNLKKWIKDTFNDKSANGKLGDKLWSNIMVDGLTQKGREASYIPKEVFVSALLDEIYYGSDDSDAGECKEPGNQEKTGDEIIFKDPYDFQSLWDAINDPSVCLPRPFQRVIRQAYAESHQNLETFRMMLERWFEMAMERNKGTYKKKAQYYTFKAAIVVTLLLNVDSVKLASHFYDNPEEAKRIADQAEIYIKENQNLPLGEEREIKETIETLQADIKRINELKLPIGWSNADFSIFNGPLTKEACWSIFAAILSTTMGWTLTIFAVSLGAPFWFDTLNKLVNLRAAGKMPNGSSHLTSADKFRKETQPAVG